MPKERRFSTETAKVSEKKPATDSVKAPASETAGEMCELHFVKAGHQYSYRYERGREMNLVCALLTTALDSRLNLDLEDARKVLGALGYSILPTIQG